ncbi:probable inactive histone-lysine N-methyltransferase SUVR2 isoform X2 [Malania oleifera]|uniref:probable inactive histone-lysine N-methyltransferase SUVR2 isoform X2 n=1 Tax=Malania oleifera TaxID=397392 RepID=UPI0025AE56E4|nr:probable inactive histone-lysine N-methyltransferase SUVR2 isoform X2 [Malania oleifera]XP_057961880.1 probable inactive histone-lysine N-methyltransferase SUVR2 isoform X2 [Malania oleifera]XP_057961881.1 probable inactive histone-lysine N-methyltransferase SUVR2 isoform X2 [Malania oleifera]
MSYNPKVCKAFSAMRALGIKDEVVKPVLKNLLKLYDKNWELIEEDNYRTLADAIFEYEESKEVEDVKEDRGPEPPHKRLHLEQQEDQVSSTMEYSGSMVVLEEGEIPLISCRQEVMESSLQNSGDRRTESSYCRPHAQSNDRGKAPVSSHLVPRDKKSTSDRGKAHVSSHLVPRDRKSTSDRPPSGVQFKQSMNERASVNMQTEGPPRKKHNETFIKLETEQFVTELPTFTVPTSMVHSALPSSLEGSSTGYSSFKSQLSQYMDNKDDGSAHNCGTSCESNFDIASSPLGEVKISLNCHSVIGQSNFHIPKLDAVLKFVEDKYLRTYKIVGPQFSVVKLLKDLCEYYLELGTNSNDRSAIIKSSAKVNMDGRGGHHHIIRLRDAVNIGNFKKDSDNKEVSCHGSSSSRNLVVRQRQTFSPKEKKPYRKINDIAKGSEKVKISLVDEIGCKKLPKFVYIHQNTVYQNAYLHFSLSRIADEDCCPSCSADCLSSSIPCACARETGGEFAYTSQGLLREEFLRNCISMKRKPQKHHIVYCQDCPLERSYNEQMPEPCKGHLVRKFIKECWRKCGCNMRCGNRVVQRGITCSLQVFLTEEGKGWGVRTLEVLPRGTFVCEYVGEILTNMELDERNKERNDERHTYPVLLDADWGSEEFLKDEEALCLDATLYGNVARFVNHRCFDANLIEVPVAVETPDHHYYHLAFFTNRDVDALEELTWDYGIDFDDHTHPIKAFMCRCGSPFCRDKKRRESKGSKEEEAEHRCFYKVRPQLTSLPQATRCEDFLYQLRYQVQCQPLQRLDDQQLIGMGSYTKTVVVA